jgi:amidase
MKGADLVFLPATEMASLVRKREISVCELLDAHLEQIQRVNPKVNAIVTLTPEKAKEDAKKADEAIAKGRPLGPLHGLPVAHKDLVETKGVRTTYGSLIFKDHVPDIDALIVERLKGAGAISVGKTNTPEFGAGSQTFNAVFGPTRNPYDLTKTCGGSSGGAAVALACGMVPLADGSDLGGSLRNPASFCNVVGFRPSPGRVPTWPTPSAWFNMTVEGPMARTVQDVALMLTAIAGPDPRCPISLMESPEVFSRPLERDFKGTRIAWSRDLGGLPVEKEVTSVLEEQRKVFVEMGCVVEEDEPDLTDADEIFRVWRAWRFELSHGKLLEECRGLMKSTVVWNIEEGRKLSGPQLGQAEVKRTALYHRVRQFMERYEFLLLPVSQVLPFPVEEEYVREINGIPMTTYLDWMRSCYYITVTGLPAISVPAGFTSSGLPVGLQIVGRPWDDFGVLQLAYAFQEATGFWRRRPEVAL